MEKIYSADGTAIVYDIMGSGPAIILIDGAFCSRTFGPMVKLAPLLSEHFRVCTYDRRGRGDSGNTAPYSVQREVEDIQSIIKSLGGPVSLFGISSGAILAIHTAATGTNITQLAIFEPPFSQDKNRAMEYSENLRQIKNFVANNEFSQAATFFLRKIVRAPFILPLILKLTPFWKKMKSSASSLPHDVEIFGDGTIPKEALAKIKIPALVLGGEKSPKSLTDPLKSVAGFMQNGKYEILKGQTHNVSPKVLAPVLVELFSKMNGSSNY